MSTSPPLRAVVVDDERLARQELLYLLRDFSDVEAVGEADSVPRAACLIAAERPDVVFLDVQMGGQTGFDLLHQLDPACRVVFVTGYDRYAVDAFEINALDYLLKPVQPRRLTEAIRRLMEERAAAAPTPAPAAASELLFLRFGKQAWFVHLHEIAYISAAGDYSEVVTVKGRRTLVSDSLKQWEAKLPPEQFVRLHRSTIANLDCIDTITPSANNAYLVHLHGQEEPLRMSRRYASKIKHRYGPRA